MKKLIFFFCITILLLSNLSIGNCSELPQGVKEKPTIMFAFAGCLNKYKMYDDEFIKITKRQTQKAFLPNYNLYLSEQYKKPYNAPDAPDIASLAREDVIDLFKSFHPDYIIIYEALPFQSSTLGPKTSGIHLKIIDVSHNQYIADQTFNYSSTWANLKGHFNAMYSKVESEVYSKHFPNITLANPKNLAAESTPND